MNSIFDSATQSEILGRVEKLTENTGPQWGKMTCAQMLEHCARGFEVPVGDRVIAKSPLKFIGRMFKKMAISDDPFGKNSPTAPEFRMKETCEFNQAKQRFLSTFKKVSAGPQTIVNPDHAFFGMLTPEQWGMFLYKHTDHHLRQFGA